jgi:anaerobic magnesium-protoporphyrin IX monomethyl ester cyclase
MSGCRVLVVDLNNFARYPTIAVGYLVSVLRAADCSVSVLSPLFHGVPGVEREPTETTFRGMARRVNFMLSSQDDPATTMVRRALDWGRKNWAERDRDRIVEAFDAAAPGEYDVVLISAYLMYYDVCAAIGERCRALGLPLLVGGSYFADREVAQAWLAVPGLTALIAGEVELELPQIVDAAVQREDLSRFEGVRMPDGRGDARRPLQDLDRVPFPDYEDFPWHLYPNRIIPMITGRGCGWGVCAFCSDVTSTAGRTYRSRSAENVLDEVEFQADRHSASLFVFTDLKLNSNLEVWAKLIACIDTRVHHPRWIGAVHVAAKQPNGLDRATLGAAKRAGLERLTTGLEAGSQRVLDAMKKGTDLEVTSKFLRDAASAGISVRVTMIHGYPGEQVEDVVETAQFLERHTAVIDRVLLNRFQVMIGPAFLRRFDSDPQRFPEVRSVKREPRLAIASHEYTPAQTLPYARATQRLLSAVHRINRKALSGSAAQFEGVM